jgi:hypothetical protein
MVEPPKVGQVLKLPPYIVPTRGTVIAVHRSRYRTYTIVTMRFEVGGIGMREIGIPLEDLEPVQ